VAVRYVALGDSYTIGTGVGPPDRWPDRLSAALGDDPGLELVANLGVNGYTSADLIRRELPAVEMLVPELASVLIGVNDVVQGVSAARYEANVVVILDALLGRLPADRIFAVAIPDYTLTPGGAAFGDPRQRRAAIVAANAVMAGHVGLRGIGWIDISDLSRRAADDPSLVAGDGLHPSGAQYALWVERIAPIVAARLAG
jgi:lysophospholipase L1-like esterase